MTTTPPPHALPLAMLIAGAMLVAGVGAGCKSVVEAPAPPPVPQSIPVDEHPPAGGTIAEIRSGNGWTARTIYGGEGIFTMYLDGSAGQKAVVPSALPVAFSPAGDQLLYQLNREGFVDALGIVDLMPLSSPRQLTNIDIVSAGGPEAPGYVSSPFDEPVSWTANTITYVLPRGVDRAQPERITIDLRTGAFTRTPMSN